MNRRIGFAATDSILLIAALGLAVPGMGLLGSAFGGAIAGSVASGAPTGDQPTEVAVSTQAAIAGQAGRATVAAAQASSGVGLRHPSAAQVRQLRDAAAIAYERGHRSVSVPLANGESAIVGGLPRYSQHTIDVPHVPGPEYEPQARQLTALLDEAWDASFARGFFETPQGRQMFEFTGMDTHQRKASRLIYSPDGVVSIYMHGSPTSASRHAIVLHHDPKNPQRATQSTSKLIQLSTGKTKISDMGSNSISVEDIATRLERADLPEGTPILFRACSAGGCPSKGVSIAQSLADRTGRPVVATSDIHRRPVKEIDGVERIEAHVEGDTGIGSWRLFLPAEWHENLPSEGALRVSELRGPHELYLLPDGAFDEIIMDVPVPDFLGIQNYGALVTAAAKLAPGGELRFDWDRSLLEALHTKARKAYWESYRSATNTKEGIQNRLRRLLPDATVEDLVGQGFQVETVQDGANLSTTVRAP
ncbi:MAG: hypothetical protein KC416_00115 [Myxococcales bacterium]|nr:hypothetical protein [Myxococcales bacterium]